MPMKKEVGEEEGNSGCSTEGKPQNESFVLRLFFLSCRQEP